MTTTIVERLDISIEDRIGIDFPKCCYRCEFKPTTKKDYNRHCIQKHRGLAGYPNKASIEKYNLECQGGSWEK